MASRGDEQVETLWPWSVCFSSLMLAANLPAVLSCGEPCAGRGLLAVRNLICLWSWGETSSTHAHTHLLTELSLSLHLWWELDHITVMENMLKNKAVEVFMDPNHWGQMCCFKWVLDWNHDEICFLRSFKCNPNIYAFTSQSSELTPTETVQQFNC